MDAFNIFFTSTGRRVALIQSFKKVLMDLGVPGTIVTTDSHKNAPAAFAADVSKLFPRITDANYINILLGICEKHQIKLLISLFNPGQSSGYFHDDYKSGIIASGVLKYFQVNEN
jgi:carbamoyl-phosphate synthase large subunit